MNRKIDLAKPLMVIEYLLEKETRENYISDHAKEVGIKVDEDNELHAYDFFNKHDYFRPKNDFAFCWATHTYVSIAEMEKFIAKAKEKGATHLDIHHHSDHGNYNLHALRFRKVTKNELKVLHKMKNQARTSAIKKIDTQIDELLKEKESLSK